jgi:hypothetical protein
VAAHPLTTYVYQTFGRQFGELLLTGYGAEPGGGHRKLYFTESGARWAIELVAQYQPCLDEPLVLAALLKLLLSRPSISQQFTFELRELLVELRWDEASARQQAENAIGVYVRLLYDKQLDEQPERDTSATEGGGCYHLLTGYVREGTTDADGAHARTIRSVYFDAGFIEGVKRGRVRFAGIDFGALNLAGGEARA